MFFPKRWSLTDSFSIFQQPQYLTCMLPSHSLGCPAGKCGYILTAGSTPILATTRDPWTCSSFLDLYRWRTAMQPDTWRSLHGPSSDTAPVHMAAAGCIRFRRRYRCTSGPVGEHEAALSVRAHAQSRLA